MKVPNTTGAYSGDWSRPDSDGATTSVQSGESTLAQVASRLGVSLDDLRNANRQLANTDTLTAGQEILLPPPQISETDGPEETDTDNAADTAAPASPKSFEGNLDASIMRLLLNSPSSGALGGFTPTDSGSPGSASGAPASGATPIHNGTHPQDAKDVAAKLKTVEQNPEFKKLDATQQKTLLDALKSKSPMTEDKIAKTLDLMKSAQSLSASDRNLVLDGLKGAHADPAYAANLKQLINDPKFKSLSDAEKTAVLSQVKNYPDARAVHNIDRMLQKGWFTSQSLDDKQRSLKTVARLSAYDKGDRQIIDRTLDKFLNPKSDFKLEWKTYDDSGSTTYGEGGDKTLSLNKGLIDADNNKMVENDDTDHLTLSTVPHEVNHLLNKDKVEDNFHYFEAEYRAWYTGFRAEHGRPPTRQEAIEQRIRWQFDPESFYGQHAAEAMKDPKEAKKFFDFLAKITGNKVDATNWQTVLNSDPKDWKNKATGPAPVPSGNVDNH